MEGGFIDLHVRVASQIFHYTTKRHLKHSGLIIKNLVSKGKRTIDLCYNDTMTITLSDKTSFIDLLLCYTALDHYIAFTAR